MLAGDIQQEIGRTATATEFGTELARLLIDPKACRKVRDPLFPLKNEIGAGEGGGSETLLCETYGQKNPQREQYGNAVGEGGEFDSSNGAGGRRRLSDFRGGGAPRDSGGALAEESGRGASSTEPGRHGNLLGLISNRTHTGVPIDGNLDTLSGAADPEEFQR